MLGIWDDDSGNSLRDLPMKVSFASGRAARIVWIAASALLVGDMFTRHGVFQVLTTFARNGMP